MIFYNFCLSKSTDWKPMSPLPKLRRAVQAIVMCSLIFKFLLYLRMWRKISSQAQRYLPEEYHGRCKELSGLLFGQLVYSASEFLPMCSAVTSYFISRHIVLFNTKFVAYVIFFTMPSILLFLLPTIQIFTTPPIKKDVTQCLLHYRPKCVKPNMSSEQIPLEQILHN